MLLIVSSYLSSTILLHPIFIQIESLYVLVDGKTPGGVQAVLPGEAQWKEAAVAAHTGPCCTKGRV